MFNPDNAIDRIEEDGKDKDGDSIDRVKERTSLETLIKIFN